MPHTLRHHSPHVYSEHAYESSAEYQDASGRAAFVFANIVSYIANIVEGLLALRLILRFFGANTATPFVRFVYNISEPLAGPFRGILPASSVGNFLVDWSVVFAMVVYALIAYAIIELIRRFAYRA